MSFRLTPDQQAIVEAAQRICGDFPPDYWREADAAGRYPHEFFAAVAQGGWLGICMPEEFGGAALGATEAALFLRTVAASGAAHSGVTAIQMSIFGLQPVVKFATEAQKRNFLPPVVAGEHKVCFAVTEPDPGLDTTRAKVKAERRGEGWVISGKKVWTSAAQVADRILILARTTPLDRVARPADGLSLFYAPLDRAHVDIRPIDKMGSGAIDANELFFDDFPVPADSLIGEEGKALTYLFSGLNAERVFIAAELVGIGMAALDQAVRYARERVVFGRPIGQNQGVQFPLARNWAELEAANQMMLAAAELYDLGLPCGPEANAAKLLAADAAKAACDTAILTHGGYGYAREYHVERYLREAYIGYIAPVTPQLVLSNIAERKLGLPKSY